MKVMRCKQGHFYDGAVFDTCPHCSGEALKGNGLPDEKSRMGRERAYQTKASLLSEKRN